MSFKKNITASYLGQGWAALMGIAFVPLYIKYLGMEAYGLIGVFAILQAWLALLDMGMTPTLSREMARYRAGAISVESVFDLLRSVEWICVGLTLLIIGSIWVAAPYLSTAWLKVENLSIEMVIQAFVVMGFVISARLWEEVYRGSIRGMQQHVWLNIMQAVLATARWAGAFAVIIWISATLKAFFIWNGLVSLFSVIIYAHKTYHWLPSSDKTGKFSLDAIRSVGRFAGGMVIITLLALMLTQIDKLLLSGLLPLEQFGYYALASVIAAALGQLISPMNAAVYPRFSELVAHHDEKAIVRTYHNSCQLLSALIIPPALVLSIFAEQVLLFWTGDPVLTGSVAPILRLLAIGVLFNGFMNVPYMLQLAYGWTGFAIRVNLIAVLIVIPAIFLVVPRFGAIGAAWVWVILNVGYVLIGVQFMYRRLLPDQKWRWYREAIIFPLISGSVLTIMLYFILPAPESRFSAGVNVLLVSLCVGTIVALVLPSVRGRFKLLIR